MGALTGRALITGGTSGLGLEFARQLAATGVDLVLVARNEERLAATATDLAATGVRVETLTADLSDQADIDRVKARLADDEVPVTILVNNAGHGLYHPLVTDDTAPHERALTVMVWAMLELGAAASWAMKARGAGHIINTASVSGLVPMGHYSAIKSWTKTYSESLAVQLEGTGVGVTTFMPGWVRTEFHKRANMGTSSIPDWLWLDPAEIVATCLADARKGKVISIPSLKFKVISRLATCAPRSAVRKVVGKISRSRSK